jgi:transposase
MLPKDKGFQFEYEYVTIDRLVPEDHMLRKIEAAIDFSFIREKCRHLYCENNGRPAYDPIKFFKTIFIGYFYGIRSERQLIREIQVNVAYRWFLGLSLTDSVIDHSTLSQNRRRRFNDSTIAQEIFDEIVFRAIEGGLISGEELFTDSTHLKANANKKKYIKVVVHKQTTQYLNDLEQAVNEDRESNGKKPFPPKPDEPQETKEIKQSKTDPESGYMARSGKPEGFFFLDHRTVDGKHNFITDVFVTPGNASDSTVYLERLDYQLNKFGFKVKGVALDAGYSTPEICHGLVTRRIFGVLGKRRSPASGKLEFKKRNFVYLTEENVYVCPNGCKLVYASTNRQGYREYASNPHFCKVCPDLKKCTTSKTHQKKVSRHIWESDKEQLKANKKTEAGIALYDRRKETIERSFADAKELHGYRYARFRGIQKVTDQCLLTAACQNIKKIALIFDKRKRKELKEAIFSFIRHLKPNYGLFSKQYFHIADYGANIVCLT